VASKVDRRIFLQHSPAHEARDPNTLREIFETPSLRNYIEEIEALAEEYRNCPLACIPFSLFQAFERNGERTEYESAYFARRRRLVTLGLASWLWKKPEDIAALEDVIWAICDEWTWALPAHLAGVSWKNCRTQLDLFACETGFALAEIIVLLETILSVEVQERARREVQNRVLQPFIRRKKAWNWELMRNNWCAVCAGSIGAAALYLETNQKRLSAIIERVLPTMDRFLSSFAEDGTCLEGLGYWTYGVGFFVSFSDALMRATEGHLDLTAHEKFRRIAAFQRYCYLNGNKTLSFADSSSEERYRIGLTTYIERKFPEVRSPDAFLAAGFSHDFYGRWCLSFRDLLWGRDAEPAFDAMRHERKTAINVQIGTKAETPKYHHTQSDGSPFEYIWLPESQWLICPAHKTGQLAFAAKGGHNDEPHNHNDIGSFELIAGQYELLADLGSGEYSRDYFSDARYSIFCNSSLGHSLPIINGKGQASGPSHCAKDVTFRQKGSHIALSMDIANAYDCRELTHLVRTFEFDGYTRTLVLNDVFSFSEPGIKIIERFVSRCPERLHIKEKPGAERPYLNIVCSVSDAIPIPVSHVHREHDGRETHITSLDFHFQPESRTFSVSFEFILISEL
jgi:hypothetical protein